MIHVTRSEQLRPVRVSARNATGSWGVSRTGRRSRSGGRVIPLGADGARGVPSRAGDGALVAGGGAPSGHPVGPRKEDDVAVPQQRRGEGRARVIDLTAFDEPRADDRQLRREEVLHALRTARARRRRRLRTV